MNELKVNLENLTDLERKQLTALLEKSQQKPVEKWQPKGGDYCIYGDSYIGRRGCDMFSEYTKFGSVYQTVEQAEKARDAMRTHNRLLAWLAENDDGWSWDWEDSSSLKWTVCYNHRAKSYKADYNTAFQFLGAVYMSKAKADRLCDLLNDGAVEL